MPWELGFFDEQKGAVGYRFNASIGRKSGREQHPRVGDVEPPNQELLNGERKDIDPVRIIPDAEEPLDAQTGVVGEVVRQIRDTSIESV
jgi:hypothetical protein